jgi:hypothetical protein
MFALVNDTPAQDPAYRQQEGVDPSRIFSGHEHVAVRREPQIRDFEIAC